MYGEIKRQFKEVIKYSQGISDPKVDRLFEDWEMNKSKFIKRFGGLIYEWPEPVEFTLDSKEKQVKAREFTEIVHDRYQNAELSRFLDANIDSFFENIVEDSLGLNIPKGMKLIKAFKFFEKDKAILNHMQDLASQYIQENKIKGTLCFSVHPLDFLSSSENTYNWRSCHALDGEYRAGNLSYMTDDVTFMVYLKGADNEKLPNFPMYVPWNSKKWRMLLHARPDDSLMFAGRQYPFSSKNGIEIVLNIYNNLVGKETDYSHFWYCSADKFMPWSDNYITRCNDYDDVSIKLADRYMLYGSRLIGLEEAIVEGNHALNYNDLLYSSCYTKPYYTTLNHASCSVMDLRENPLRVGSTSYCLECGMDHIEDSGYMRCPDCELQYGDSDDDCYTYCACCETRVYYDDTYIVNDSSVCDRCFSSECFVCDGCGEADFNENLHIVTIQEQDRSEVKHFCEYCYECYLEEKEGKE